MALFHDSAIVGASGNQGGTGGYQLSRSLRFNSADSAYLSRTPASAGNRKTWTWAGWVKNTCSTATTIPVTLLSARNGEGAGIGEFFWLAINNIFTADGHQIAAGDGNVNYLVSTASFRDPSAWYHIVCAYDSTQATANNRLRLYVNGTEITVFNTNNRASLTQNSDGVINRTSIEHRMGLRISEYSNCYLADVHFIDGQALTPSSFAETNATTGQWVPKAYTGNYGTNGFRLDFSDNSAATATTLGKDYSGNSNNWTPNNLSVTAGAGNDSLVDTPTSYGTGNSGGDVRGNYATLNPIDMGNGITLSNGNLDVAQSLGTDAVACGTIGVTSGKWYWEVQCTSGNNSMVGIADFYVFPTSSRKYSGSGLYYYQATGGKYGQIGGSFANAAYGASFTTSDIIGVALDMDNGNVNFYKNGVNQGVANTTTLLGKTITAAVNNGGADATNTFNFGQRPFAYTAPSGFKALCDTNLPAPVVAKSNSVFDVALWTGNGSARSITGLNFNPDFVWIKGRSGATDHALYDAVRGATIDLVSNSTAAETTQTQGLTAFNSDGFSLGTLAKVNTNTATYAGWAWDAGSSTVTNTQGSITSQVRANASAGFSIVTYTGTGANATVGHGLNVSPSLLIIKSRGSARNWAVWHKAFGTAGSTDYLYLNSTLEKGGDGGDLWWNSTVPGSNTFSLGSAVAVNTNAINYVAYCFAPVAGYSAFGSYTGNGSADGPFVYTGFRPRFILIKRTNASGNWLVLDAARLGYNARNNELQANLSAAEGTYNYCDILSNGFKLRGNDVSGNASGSTYVWAAFAESPFQYARAR